MREHMPGCFSFFMWRGNQFILRLFYYLNERMFCSEGVDEREQQQQQKNNKRERNSTIVLSQQASDAKIATLTINTAISNNNNDKTALSKPYSTVSKRT